jgi:urease accessory protein
MSLAEASAPDLFAPPQVLERARGTARVAFVADAGITRLAENFQSGSAKARFPKPRAGQPPEVVLLNTAGGVTGGDHLTYAVSVAPSARAVATTQAAERIYRRSTGTARIDTTLSVGEDASLDWLPQETILFDRSALRRTLTADVHPAGRLLAVESIVLGRTAMGETIRDATLADNWRIRRGGKFVFADGLRLAGDSVAILAGGATGRAAIAVAAVVLIAPDAETAIETARGALEGAASEAGASAWNGMLVARLAAPNGQALRADVTRLIEALRGVTMPGTWRC